MPLQRLEQTINGFQYIAEFDRQTEAFDFRINYPVPKDIPESLIKYYALNNNNIEAVTSSYLFASHPDQLNDKYDCSSDLLEYSALRKDTLIQRLVTEIKRFTLQEFNELWESEFKWVIIRAFSDSERIRLFMKFGIISFSTKENDILLWSYYAQNNGFAIKFNTESLPKEFIGPFYINYCPELIKIDSTESNAPLCVHYLTNAKLNIWEHEDEWRYVTFNSIGHFHPEYGKSDINSRKFHYHKNSISEIILGYNFFNIKEINRLQNFDLISLKPNKGKGMNAKKVRRRLLSLIVKNQIPCSRIIRKTQDYELYNEPIVIEQISCNKFRIISNLQEQ